VWHRHDERFLSLGASAAPISPGIRVHGELWRRLPFVPADWLALHITVQDRVFQSSLLGTTSSPTTSRRVSARPSSSRGTHDEEPHRSHCRHARHRRAALAGSASAPAPQFTLTAAAAGT